jgi:hypothetical protein
MTTWGTVSDWRRSLLHGWLVGWLVGWFWIQYALKAGRTAFRNIPCSCVCSGSLHTVHSLIQPSTEQLVPVVWSALHTETFKLLKFVLTPLLKLAMHHRVQTICVSSSGRSVLLLKLLVIRLCILNARRYSPVTSCCVCISYERTCQLLHRASFGS